MKEEIEKRGPGEWTCSKTREKTNGWLHSALPSPPIGLKIGESISGMYAKVPSNFQPEWISGNGWVNVGWRGGKIWVL